VANDIIQKNGVEKA